MSASEIAAGGSSRFFTALRGMQTQ